MSGLAMTSETSPSDTQQIWREFGDRLRAFIAYRVGSEADTEDILQDVFLRIHLHVGSVRSTDRLTSWLFQITRNAIVDYYRAPTRREQPECVAIRSTLELAEVPAATEEHDLDAARARVELAGCLRPLIERLPPLYREAVALVDLAGLSQTQAAARLGLSVSGMKSRVQRGRRVLKDILVDCCPVQLDAGGRVVDYDLLGPSCPTCAGSAEVVTIVRDTGTRQGRCCAPPPASAGEAWSLDPSA